MLRKLVGVLVGVGCFLSVAVAYAGECLVNRSNVAAVTSTASNQAMFVVRTVGGTGPCDGNYVVFDVALAPDLEAHKRAFTLATTALISGKRVTIFSYTGVNCNEAVFIQMDN